MDQAGIWNDLGGQYSKWTDLWCLNGIPDCTDDHGRGIGFGYMD